MQTALNHMTTPRLGYADFLDLAARLGCVGVEVRNDIARPLFDGMDAADAGKLVTDKGLRLVGLSQVYPFNTWDTEREAAVRTLIATAQKCGAETISLIPRNDGTQTADGERQANLRTAMTAILPMLQDAGLVALVEPLGFGRSSLRSKTELVEAITEIGGEHFKLVHDTFHHTLAGGGPIFPGHTGIIHISGVVDPALGVDQMEDEHRVLVDASDRLGNTDQIAALLAAGYQGPVSYECFSPQTHALTDPYTAIKRSFDFISSQLREKAA
ncbi:TIM barrel protein [Puniceibacterium sp. IMCC21224]|uniref:TIM barrel protein n=1 Tax=Puniceibacterium sp. IMCC21224 TaxID=1618204 RepID=UPI00064DEA35|nr:TIM barrel protein [Puniceibacterium sp. IMCC21224]KMK68991.1 putative sugar epimerase [Puniceibacterium sp. IMCC21224]